MIGYKLFRKRQDGTLGPLFINKRLKLSLDIVYEAECIPTKGFKVRPGWHICSKPEAPHLSKKNRHWYVVEFSDYVELIRPEIQGGVWYIANNMKIISPLTYATYT
jgi:hypothetical protein